jgi:hypothetical protein
MKKPLAIALSWARRELRRREGGGDQTHIQYKPNWNCHHESPPYNKCILIKIPRKRKKEQTI